MIAPCGTPAAYRRHLRYGETACEPCLEANRLKGVRYRRAQGVQEARPARCGTHAGYRRHRANGEDACGPCKRAAADYESRRTTGRRRAMRIWDCILDELSSDDRWLSATDLSENIVARHPEWEVESIRRVAYRMVAEGAIRSRSRGGRTEFYTDPWWLAGEVAV